MAEIHEDPPGASPEEFEAQEPAGLAPARERPAPAGESGAAKTGASPEREISPEEFEARKDFLDFDAADGERLRSVQSLAAQYADPVIDAFYEHVLAFAETRRFFRDPEVLRRVKAAQKEYFLRLTGGEYGLDYMVDRLRIGRVHERLDLPVKSYLGMYAFYLRTVAGRLFDALPGAPGEALAVLDSLLKVVFLDIGLAIDTYIIHRDRTIWQQQEDLAERARELEVAKQWLQAANRELEAFAYSVSHDLRAPLRAIDGFSLAVLEDFGHLLPPDGRAYLTRMRGAAQRMAQLIDDLLKLSRISRAPLSRIPVDLSALARRIADSLIQGSPERAVRFEIAGGLEARADPELLHVVLANLLENAWKFTGREPAPHIEVGSEERAGERFFYVRDNGVGFDPKYADRLFGAFQRLHSSEDFPGTGIGLATVKRVVERHGGRVWARGALGEGATFYFSLPDTDPAGE